MKNEQIDYLNIDGRLAALEKAIQQLLAASKKVMTFHEACEYSNISPSYMYKIVRKLPFSKPNGKTLYISKDALDEWLLSKPVKTHSQIEKEAATYVATKNYK
jgi:excisionase family DNA binding protein